MTGDDNRKTARRTKAGCDNQETEANGEMWNDQRRDEDGFQRPLQAEGIAIEHESESRADKESQRRGACADDQSVAKAGAEILIGERLGEPTPGERIRRK